MAFERYGRVKHDGEHDDAPAFEDHLARRAVAREREYRDGKRDGRDELREYAQVIPLDDTQLAGGEAHCEHQEEHDHLVQSDLEGRADPLTSRSCIDRKPGQITPRNSRIKA